MAAFAILRHRLYDIDLVLNRALTYGLLTAIIAGAYAALVLGVGALASGHGTLLAAIAAALCALAFAPLRAWLQRAVNRLLYGARHEPAEAVETLGRQLGETVDPADLLPTLVAVIARTLRLGYVAVELAEDDGFTRAAEVGTPAGETYTVPLVAQGETVGRLVLAARRPGETLSDADRRVLEMLSAQAGPAVLAVRLNAQLARSREQLVSAREEERRRLRRDLHDGLGPTLAAIGLQLAAASALLERPEELRALHAELQEQTRQAVTDIRRLVYDLRPPALDELGLAPADRAAGRALHRARGRRAGRGRPRRPAGRGGGGGLSHRRRGDHERGPPRRGAHLLGAAVAQRRARPRGRRRRHGHSRTRRRPASGSTRCASARPSSAGRARSARRPAAARACARGCPWRLRRALGLMACSARR